MGKFSEAAAASFEVIEHDLEQAWVRHPEVPESVRMQLAIAVAEVVGNSIEHGGAQHRPVRIEDAAGPVRHRVGADLLHRRRRRTARCG